MTVLLTKPYGLYNAGATIDLDNVTEAAIVGQGLGIYTVNPGSSYSPLTAAEQQDVHDKLATVVTGTTSALTAGGRTLIDLASANSSNGAVICDWTNNGALSMVSSNGGGEAIALDPTKLCDGLPMVKATCGSTGTYIAQFVFTTAVTLAQMQSLQIPIQVSQNQAVFGGTGMAQIWLFDDATGTRQWRLATSLNMSKARPGVTSVLSFSPGAATEGWAFGGSSAPTSTTDMDAFTINRIRIVIAVPAAVAGEAVWFGTIRANARRKPVVSIVLDGQYSSQDQYILPMIEAQGLRASMALQYSLIGTGGRMTEAQLQRAYDYGHELIHHTFDGSKTSGYQSAAEWPDGASITSDIAQGQAYMRARSWTSGLGYAVNGGSVSPYSGAVALARQVVVADAIRAAGIKAVRSGDGFGTAPVRRLQPTSRTSNVDLLSIQGALQWTSTDNAAALTVPITGAKSKGEWAIYTGHRTVISGPGSLEILNSDCLTWLQTLGDEVRSGRVLCLPFGEACRYYGLTT